MKLKDRKRQKLGPAIFKLLQFMWSANFLNCHIEHTLGVMLVFYVKALALFVCSWRMVSYNVIKCTDIKKLYLVHKKISQGLSNVLLATCLVDRAVTVPCLCV